MNTEQELKLAMSFIEQVREDLLNESAWGRGSFRKRVRQVLQRYDDSIRCQGHKMARCVKSAGHEPPCDYQVDSYRAPEREFPADGLSYPRCNCPKAGIWGAGREMPEGHIWQWQNPEHSGGYLAHMPHIVNSCAACWCGESHSIAETRELNVQLGLGELTWTR